MRIRQYVAAIMILLSLSAQASTAIACSMMPAVALAQCCCPGDMQNQSLSAAESHNCCDQVAPADAPLAHVAGGFGKHLTATAANHLPPAAAVESHWLPASFDTGDRRHLHFQLGADRRRARPLYLQTARLRL